MKPMYLNSNSIRKKSVKCTTLIAGLSTVSASFL